MTIDIALLAEGWIAYWLAPENSAAQESFSWALDLEYDLILDDPDAAWFLILEILRRNNTPQILEVLSAGPLENLLAKHGDRMIATVEAEAKNNPSFASLLGGVWKNDMSEDVWSRVQAVWNRTGWDGIE
jgi:hypothetical protein